MRFDEMNKKKIWIDLDNTPHVPFFHPIIRELRKKGYPVLITARDCFQVCGLADLYGMSYQRIGIHYGKNKAMKVLGTVFRAVQLTPVMLREKPVLAVSHGSRSQLLLSRLQGIKSVLIMDYEFSQKIADPSWIIMPEVIPDSSLPFRNSRIIRYPGIKEDVYVPEFESDSGILGDLGISAAELVATIRPPATEAHYHNPESEILFSEVISRLGAEEVRMIILPRNERQNETVRKQWTRLIENGRIVIPEKVVNGLNLIWHSDLVISGGGTINREAAALGVPVYSIFRGRLGAIDDYLSREGRLHIIAYPEDVKTSIVLQRRKKDGGRPGRRTDALRKIVTSIEKIMEGEHGTEPGG
ncbi:MAG: DUF354 domain-containing protein [Syntrophales bacterium]|nr:DUF354 domain-containing protein [Syntrophales bacterium]MDD5532126.1 DUF354 domain-containing protein [Syntrophales bacterium]